MSSLVKSQSVAPGPQSHSFLSSTNACAPLLFYKTVAECLLPYGLAVRIPGFHPGGPGSTPGMGSAFGFPSLWALSQQSPRLKALPPNSAVCLHLHGLSFTCWTPFTWLKTVSFSFVNRALLQLLFPAFSISPTLSHAHVCREAGKRQRLAICGLVPVGRGGCLVFSAN